MSEIKQPQDHKPKPQPYKFTGADGKTYSLPFASKGAAQVTGRQTRDAMMDGEVGEVKLGFIMLDLCGAKQEAIDAILDLPADETVEHIAQWMKHGDGDGASVPQS